MKNKLILLNIIFCFAVATATAVVAAEDSAADQNLQAFEWNQDSCYCKGKIDTSKISAETAILIINRLEAFQVNQGIPWSELHEYSQSELEDELTLYIEESDLMLKKLDSLELPAIPELIQYKKDRLFEEKLRYFLYVSELNYLITGSNKHLEKELENQSHLAACGDYSKKLLSAQSIQNATPAFVDELCNKNGDPASCKRRFEYDANVPTKAKTHLLKLGWHNCVNHYYRTIWSPNYDEAFKAVNHFILDTTCECDDAD
ncbi:MAG: hypothetical protein IPK77_02895 [Cellvibrio sp.]|nr:hypothetical protein [Cellvibrio sp.]